MKQSFLGSKLPSLGCYLYEGTNTQTEQLIHLPKTVGESRELKLYLKQLLCQLNLKGMIIREAEAPGIHDKSNPITDDQAPSTVSQNLWYSSQLCVGEVLLVTMIQVSQMSDDSLSLMTGYYHILIPISKLIRKSHKSRAWISDDFPNQSFSHKRHLPAPKRYDIPAKEIEGHLKIIFFF